MVENSPTEVAVVGGIKEQVRKEEEQWLIALQRYYKTKGAVRFAPTPC